MPVNVQTLGADWLVASSAMVARWRPRKLLEWGAVVCELEPNPGTKLGLYPYDIPIISSLIQSHQWAISTSISLPLHGADLRDVHRLKT